MQAQHWGPMIKRAGVEVMNARTKNVALAKETIEVTAQKKYTVPSGQVVDISQAVDDAINGTVLHKPDEAFLVPDIQLSPTIEVTNETTAQAAVRLNKPNMVALNFASARNQGGGFLAGALAQEEDLCRASALYACLKRKPVFYNENILCDDCYYTDNIIYSPKVPFFRGEHNLFLEEPFTLSIISAPAPNLNGIRPEGLQYKLRGIIRGRIERILHVAASHGHKTIILGAWGCGAFGNDPEMIADEFKKMIEKTAAFEHVCFAVYDTREPPVLYETFQKVFGAVPTSGTEGTRAD